MVFEKAIFIFKTTTNTKPYEIPDEKKIEYKTL